MYPHIPRLVISVAAAVVLAACTSAPTASSSTSAASSTMSASTSASTLFAHHWDLQQATDAKGARVPQFAALSQPMRLSFVQAPGTQGTRVVVSGLCNNMSAGVVLDGNQMRVSKAVSTMRACPDRQLMALEQLVGQQLGTVQQWKLATAAGAAPQLELRLADGSTWLLQGEPTDESRYGQAERVFLEVAPQRVACSHPLIPNYQCLQVRTVQYAENGTKKSVGEWGAFYGDIQGYQHQPGVRNVLRLNRYEPKNRPADASRYVYMLDMTVESETVK